MDHEVVAYLLSLGVVLHTIIIVLALVLIGLYTICEMLLVDLYTSFTKISRKTHSRRITRKTHFNDDLFITVGSWLIVGICSPFMLLFWFIRWLITFFQDKHRERIEAQYHAAEAQRRADERRQADDIRRISRQYQGKANQLFTEFVRDMSNER